MANKFQKSVLERLELEQSKNAQIQTEASEKKKWDADRVQSKPKSKTVPMKETTMQIEATISANAEKNVIQQYLDLSPARRARNKTFYLDIEVIEAIRKEAAHAGVADSKLVNDILRSLFEIKI